MTALAMGVLGVSCGLAGPLRVDGPAESQVLAGMRAAVSVEKTSSDRPYRPQPAVVGQYVYLEHPDVVLALPPSLAGGLVVQTAAEDAAVASTAEHLRLRIHTPGTLAVALDPRRTAQPGWLGEFRQAPANGTVLVLDGSDSLPFDVATRRIDAPGLVTLGGNDSAATGAKAHYLVFFVPDDASRSWPRTRVVGQWLFDEPLYRNQAALDSSGNLYDLRYGRGAAQTPSRSGQALVFNLSTNEPATLMAENLPYTNRFTSDLAGRPRMVPANLLEALGEDAWTWELIVRLDGVGDGESTLVDVRSAAEGVFTVAVADRGASLVMRSERDGTNLKYPAAMSPGPWRHVALVRESRQRPPRLFIDGREQPMPTPAEADDAPAPQHFQFSIGRRFDGTRRAAGAIDGLRVSRGAAYTADFTPPTTFAPPATPPARPWGPPLLFPGNVAAAVTSLETRRHVFLDETLVESKQNVTFALNPPTVEVLEGLRTERWIEEPGGIGSGYGNAIEDDAGAIHLLISNHAMWYNRDHAYLHYVTRDNRAFERLEPVNPGYGMQGNVFRDTRPDCPPAERFKWLAKNVHRGVIAWTSPDLLTWRRAPTVALPFDLGGGCEAFADDQRGGYVGLLRHEGGAHDRPKNAGFRASSFSFSDEFAAGWAWAPEADPLVRAWGFTLPSITDDYVPRVIRGNANGSPYRVRAQKYAHAPDAYLAFVWRLEDTTDTRVCELSVSRDGDTWTSYGPHTTGHPWYLDTAGRRLNGQDVLEACMMNGLIRRGNELWQYAGLKAASHVKFSPDDRVALLRQRLDGFTSLDAGPEPGLVTTRPLTFAGSTLRLNVAARGRVRVALLDPQGRPIPGFSLDDCEPLTADGIDVPVRWRQGELAVLVGHPVRLQFELQDTKLHAFQFGDAGPR